MPRALRAWWGPWIVSFNGSDSVARCWARKHRSDDDSDALVGRNSRNLALVRFDPTRFTVRVVETSRSSVLPAFIKRRKKGIGPVSGPIRGGRIYLPPPRICAGQKCKALLTSARNLSSARPGGGQWRLLFGLILVSADRSWCWYRLAKNVRLLPQQTHFARQSPLQTRGRRVLALGSGPAYP